MLCMRVYCSYEVQMQRIKLIFSEKSEVFPVRLLIVSHGGARKRRYQNIPLRSLTFSPRPPLPASHWTAPEDANRSLRTIPAPQAIPALEGRGSHLRILLSLAASECFLLCGISLLCGNTDGIVWSFMERLGFLKEI
ncbi:hypothetical protein CDAR_529941 [Caerostris darwini]|uniref:Uncharacterized protein n=1 Tax=Caerostris darwini TaxID=1538125 RepID=A0AAV4WXG3_9ARAC|nr:hypothetical protein CDAR_529941 [Caerostris darwini]